MSEVFYFIPHSIIWIINRLLQIYLSRPNPNLIIISHHLRPNPNLRLSLSLSCLSRHLNHHPIHPHYFIRLLPLPMSWSFLISLMTSFTLFKIKKKINL